MSTDTVLTDEQKDRFVSDICEYGTGFVAPLYSVVEAIEQAVLQSPEIQALRKDAERLRYILDRVCMIQAASYGCKFEILNLPPHFGDCEPDPVAPFLSAIDAAMQEQKT